jgi:hypothetical protein
MHLELIHDGHHARVAVAPIAIPTMRAVSASFG